MVSPSELDEIGFSVRSAENGLSALVEIGRKVPDVVLSDLNMPRMSGFEFLQLVRRHFPLIHLIAMSGAFVGDEVPSGVAADAFYQKGSGVRCLLKIIERFAQPRPLPVHQGTTSVPLWILRNGYDASGEPCVSIDCRIAPGTSNNKLAVPSASFEKRIACIAGIRFTTQSSSLSI